MAATAGNTPSVDDARIIDDRVMGGVSQSQVSEAEQGFVYTGTLSRDQGGGFASMRLDASTLDLVGQEGLELQVRGDGRTYQLTVQRRDVELRAGSYRASFVASDRWSTVRLPFTSFQATRKGRPVDDVPPLAGDLSAVDAVGILLSDGPEGAFRLEVRSLAPYGP